MHELSIAMSILDIAAEEAQRLKAPVRAIHLRLGPLSGVVSTALESAFGLARETTSLAACELVIENVPVVVYCETCRENRAARSLELMVCDRCGTECRSLVTGHELEIVGMEIEE